VDSVKFSGGFVAGLSLLSTRIMALSYNTGEPRSMQVKSSDEAAAVPDLCGRTVGGRVRSYTMGEDGLSYVYDEDGNSTRTGDGYINQLVRQGCIDRTGETDLPALVELALPPRSLYVLMGPWRYNYNHAILGMDQKPQTTAPLVEAPSKRTSIIFRDAKS
jgi:hypothetical protein